MTPANKGLMISGLSALGSVSGIVVAIKRKSGFIGGVGWFFLLGVAGTAAGYVIASTLKDN